MPWITAELLGTLFRFETAPGLFSDDRIDEGTRLLLDALPEGTPRSVLDMGCGYGALGLPVAARFPEANCLLVDRNAVAVEQARRNAQTAGLAKVKAHPSLGYRDLGENRFDWILSNIPARIGDAGVAYLIEEGGRRLMPHGELRAVVIRDLRAVVERLSQEHGWNARLCREGDRHAVYAMGSRPSTSTRVDHEALYRHDQVPLGDLRLDRPCDISEEPGHLREGLPLLLELLPRRALGDTLVWCGGYGATAITLAQRGNPVIAADLDLLAITFTRRNAASHGQAVSVREAARVEDAIDPDDRFRLFVGEVRSDYGRQALDADLRASAALAVEGARVLWLGLERPLRTTLGAFAPRPLASRGRYAVWELTSSSAPVQRDRPSNTHPKRRRY